MLEKQTLEHLYTSYGFEVNEGYKDLGVFLYKKGRYFGVDIIPYEASQETTESAESLKNKYAEDGYAASIKIPSSIEEAEVELYKSFFSFDATKQRLLKKYQDFQTKQTRNLLGFQYQYINPPFEIQDHVNAFGDDLIDAVSDILGRNSPQLIIIEAAAGYGKTCSAYEILNHVTKVQDLSTPIFTELSRNRGAKIFRYILLDEIDIEYPILNSEIVIQQIKKGRIPLIIDGFDELLDKVNFDKDVTDSFEQVETMLDTIGSLLDSNAKIILTTRKTAIFGGLEFDKWLEKWDQKFQTTRILIKEPKIKDWIGIERLKKIKDSNIPIQSIANPVLLTFLRNLPEVEFTTQIKEPEKLVQQYFDKMLEREKERQNLIIPVEKQYEIFKNVVKLLLDFDIATETKDFFKEIIKEQNSKLLEYTRTLYSGSQKPSLDNLVDTLATHALLDRKGRNEDLIGFINDFVLGTFIGEIICESSTEKINRDYSYYMIELATTAYRVQNLTKKWLLWDKVISVKHKFDFTSIFFFDVFLRGKLMQDYSKLTIHDASIFNINFNEFTMDSTVFLNCSFKNCQFTTGLFNGVSFVNCLFDTCQVTGDEYIDSGNEISTIKCTQQYCDVILAEQHYEKTGIDIFSITEKEILKELLRISTTKGHHIMQLLHCFEKKEKKIVLSSLRELENQTYIHIRGNHIYINTNKLPTIKQEIAK